jgi:acyl-CoA reductase-like NAD-dependent aldehyde dehydrogenase
MTVESTTTGEFTLSIGGEAADTQGVFDVVNPATEQVFGQAPDCSRAQLDAAFGSASGAFADWRKDEDARRAALAAASEAVMQAADRLAPVLTAEQGKPLANAHVEVQVASIWLKYFSELELPREVIQDDERAFSEILRRPVGPVAAITPWNYPLTLAAWKMGPALLAGNTMVLKPSPYTPLATLRMGEVLRDVLPPGVLNVVSGGDELGAWMTSHPEARKISFTGSVATGKHVAASAAPDLKLVTLELGGNDPAVLLDDVDVEDVAQKLFWGAFANNGQVCSAIKRIYAPKSLYGDVVEALTELAKAAKVGDGADEDTDLGPINNQPQYDRVRELTAEALRGGATAVTGGNAIDGPGYFFEPTILTGAGDGTRIVDEEQFGPVLPVIPYADVDDAIARANHSRYGLSGSVWSADPVRGDQVAAQMEAGTTWVNCHMAFSPEIPFGGNKWSGTGLENGHWGVHSFTEPHVVYRTVQEPAIYR